MPRGEVTLKAVFKTLHKIDVKFSTADKDTAIEGETVKIMAESRPGYVFDRWEVNNGDVAVAKKNEEETTFVMPDKPVTAVAKYKKLLGITVNSGKAYVEDDVTDAALKGKPVVIKADKIEGKLFDHWKIVSGNVILDDQRASETKFIMPETAVEITAEYNDLHAITVNNGTANVEEAVIGDTVKIKAESREGYVFDRWEVSYGDVAVANKNAEETTFVMPDSMVVLTARYKAMQSITLENGKAYAGGEEITTAKKDTEVAIKADDLDGKVFDHWEIVSGNMTLEDADKAETTFTMPVNKPCFALGYKEAAINRGDTRMEVIADLLPDLICGGLTNLYRKLYDESLVNPEFSGDYLSTEGACIIAFTGESETPREVAQMVRDEIARLRQNGVDPELFTLVKNQMYGEMLADVENVDDAAEEMGMAFLKGRTLADEIEALATLTVDDVNKALQTMLLEENSAYIQIDPKE
jgi:hypothetical protein